MVAATCELGAEHGWTALRVEGRLPPDLRGRLYRNGPARRTRHATHVFDWLGGLVAVELDGSGARGATRVVRTPTSARVEGGERLSLYAAAGDVRSRLRSATGGEGFANLANVNIQPWQGQLTALVETVKPVSIDPDTLEVLDREVAKGVRVVNAHPHRVPSRKTTYHVGMVPGPRCWLDVVAVPDVGEAHIAVSIPVPGIGEVHDFLATERELVLILSPLWAHPLRVLATGAFAPNLKWRPEDGCEVIIVPLDAPTQFRRLRTEGFFWYHGLAAVRDGDAIDAWLVGYPDFGAEPWLDGLAQGRPVGAATGSVWHLRVCGERVDIRQLPGTQGLEFPCIHPTFVEQRPRFCWLAGHVGRTDQWWDSIVRLELETGAQRRYALGERRLVGEPLVVPRSDAEDDAWLLAMVRDLDSGLSHLAIWDAQDFDAEPVARAWFPHPLHFTFHGHFRPA